MTGAQGPVIEAFTPPGRVVLPGEEAVSTVVVRNPGPGAATFWIGYSVQDPAGDWHDVPSHALTLGPGERPAPQPVRWTVPEGATPGYYRAVAALWSRPPERRGATRLADAGRADAFRVDTARDPEDRLDTEAWERGDHPLGRGGVAAANVAVEGGVARLRLRARTHAGAELRTRGRVGHGRYTARLRAAGAPGSLTAFFLYQDVEGGDDEIDIEIPGDGSRRVLLTAWVAGEQTRQAEVVLPFDPAAGFHEYTIDHHPGRLAFLVDGALLAEWREAVPAAPMRLMLNAWWPVWLEAPGSHGDAAAEVEWVRW